MNIADLIMAMKRGEDPNQAILAAAQASATDIPPTPGGGFPAVQPPGVDAAPLPAPAPASAVPPVPIPQARPANAPAPAPAPPVASAPRGVATPITNPAPPEQAPRIIQSPPDLSNMYLELIKKNQNAQALDSGMSMIAAGFSKYPENRAALLHGAFSKSGQQNLTSDDIVKLQGLQVKNQQLQIRQAAKKGLMSQYGLSRDTVDYLDSSDKLDEVIKARETGTLISIKDSATGQMSLWNNATGKKITDVGGPEAPTGVPVVDPKTGQTRFVDPKTATQIGTPIGEVKPTTGIPVIDPSTGQTTITDPTVIGATVGAPKVLNAEDKDHLASINAGRPPDKQMGTEEYLDKYKKGGVTVNVGTDGTQYPAPPTGFDYLRYPAGHKDAGKVQTGPDGKPQLYDLAGGKGGAELKKVGAEADKATREELEAQEKKNKIAWGQIRSSSSVMKSVDRALELVHQPGATGLGSKWSRMISPGGLPSDSYDAQLNTIESNMSIAELQRMREASPTGGAIGNVTDFEQKMLASTIASARSAQQSGDAQKALIRIAAMTKTIVENGMSEKATPETIAKFNAALKKNEEDIGIEYANKNKTGPRTFKNIKVIE